VRQRLSVSIGLDDARALAALLRAADDGVGHAEATAHDPEGVAHAEQRRVLVGADTVEKTEERHSHAGSSRMPCEPSDTPSLTRGSR